MDFLSIERQLLHLDSVANIDLDVQQYYGLKSTEKIYLCHFFSVSPFIAHAVLVARALALPEVPLGARSML